MSPNLVFTVTTGRQPKRPFRFAIAGMGGFAGEHHRAALALEAGGAARLVCTCDPGQQTRNECEAKWGLSGRGVRVFSDYGEMVAACRDDLDYVVISTPIPLHAPMHAAAVAAGLAVYLEKPPTLDPAELERMIAADVGAATLVAFNYIVEPWRLALKRRLLAGEFGAIRRAGFLAHSPRSTGYFERASWAGRVMMQDRLVLDCCLGNALAHSVHNMLFWLGADGVYSWAEPEEVRGTLHRAHAIESADTFFLETTLNGGIPLRLALTHAGVGEISQEEIVECERARISCRPGCSMEVRWRDGRVEHFDCSRFDGVVENHLAYQRYLIGEADRPPTTLVDSRSFVRLHALAWIAGGGVHTVPSDRIVRQPAGGPGAVGGEWLAVDGLPEALHDWVEHGARPDGAFRVGSEPGRARASDLPRLRETAAGIVAGWSGLVRS